jgi:hypothetical protein
MKCGQLTNATKYNNVALVNPIRLCSRTGTLAAHLQTNRPFDFSTIRYTQSPAQLETLRLASFRDHHHAWLDRIKPTNPEAYHYWYLGLKTL